MWIAIAIFFGVLTLLAIVLNTILAWDCFDNKDYDMAISFVISSLVVLLLGIIAIKVSLLDYVDKPRYKHIECTEYHVTQQISDKGDTTYTIKYKPL